MVPPVHMQLTSRRRACMKPQLTLHLKAAALCVLLSSSAR